MAATQLNLMTEKPLMIENMNTSSTELRRNAKGFIEIIVKVYDHNPTEAAKRATSILNGLRKKFPYQPAA